MFTGVSLELAMPKFVDTFLILNILTNIQERPHVEVKSSYLFL